ncbi:hypothetical protein OQA88_3214 [Cercophora sp. LCS_1]
MSMRSLNSELLNKILWYVRDLDEMGHPPEVDPPRYGHLAAVSREWQSLVEQWNFNTIAISLDDLPDAAGILTPHRQTIVGSLDVTIELDAYDEEARYRVETDEEQHRNNEVFTKGVKDIFRCLENWKPPSNRPGLRLTIHVSSPSDINRLSPEAAEDVVRRLPFSPLRRYEKSLILFLDEPETLPKLGHISSFGIHRWPKDGQGRHLYRNVDPLSASLLLRRCKPSLEEVSLYLMDWPRGATEERKHRRKIVAQVIDEMPSPVRDLGIAYWVSPPRDENCDPPNLLDDGETEDTLSVSLRRFYMRSKAQRVFVTRTILGAEFYRRPTKGDRGKGYRDSEGDEENESEDEEDDSEGENDAGSGNDSDFDEDWYGNHSDDDRRPCASLQDLRVDWPKVTPDGKWLYKRPVGENADKCAWDQYDTDESGSESDGKEKDEDERKGPEDPDPELDDPAYTSKHRFRIAPVSELVNPLLESMARTMRRMPALQDFYWADSTDWPAHRVEFSPNFDEGGGELAFYGWGNYEDGEELIDTGEPLVDEEVVELFTEMLSARKPEGEIEIHIE